MALGQRQRQRLIRQRRQAKLGDTAALSKRPGMGTPSAVAERWADCSRGDLRRLRQAIDSGWLDDAGQTLKGIFLDAAWAALDKSHRHALAGARVYIAADTKNLEAEAARIELLRKARAP